MKKILSLVLTILGLSVSLCMYADKSGTCGANVRWELDDYGNLIISGTGPMDDYYNYKEPKSPWIKSKEIQSVTIQEGVTRVGNFSFYFNENLTKVSLPSTIEVIGNSAFISCGKLRQVNIPGNVKEIGGDAFEFCHALNVVNLPSTLQKVGKGAFKSSGIYKVKIPARVASIEDGAFSTKTLEEITVEAGNPNYCSVDGVLLSKDTTTLMQFPAGKDITTYLIPKPVTMISGDAFANSQYLTTISMSDNVMATGWGPFTACAVLQEIRISNGLKELNGYFLARCPKLTSVTIPASVRKVGKKAFYDSNALTKISYPEGLDLTDSEAPSSAALLAYDRKNPPQESLSYENAALASSSGNNKLMYFSDYAKSYVEKAVNAWQQKDEFEKIADWQKRVNETTRNAKIKELTQQCEKEYIAKYSASLKPKVTLGQYDSENEVFLLTDAMFGNMLVPCPIDEGRLFKQNWASAQLTPTYFIDNDLLALRELDIYFPSIKKRYVYSNQASLNYAVAQVDYNFDPIEIAAESSGGPKGQQTIEQKKLAIGKSQVDLEIPETNASNQNTFVIIIANEDYKTVAPVPFALNDGRVLAKYCQRTLGISAQNIKKFENATYNDIRLAIAWLKNVCEKYEGDASVIFYYTGHGIPDESDKSAYLLPVDGDGRYVATGYKMDDLYEKLGAMPTKSVTVLLDACFSGATRDGKMVAQAKGVALKVKKGEPQGNTVVLSAAQGDETAGFNEAEGHGMFTYYILKKLQETQGNVTLQDLSQFVIREVGRKSAVTNKPQTPCVTPSAAVGSAWQSWKLK